MDYPALLRDSFRLFIKHKPLWLFGILMSLFGGGQYSFGVNYRESIATSEPGTLPLESLSPGFVSVINLLKNPTLFITIAFVSSILVWLLTQIVSSWCKTAIVGIVRQSEANEPVSWQTAILVDLDRFRSVVAISLLLGLPSLLMTLSSILVVGFTFSKFLNLTAGNIIEQAIQA